MPVGAPGWGAAADTLELAAADFGLSELARAVGDRQGERLFRTRSGWWRNLFNPKAAPEGGYIQPRNADGSWPAFDSAADDEFVEGSGAQYLWMVPFDAKRLITALGGSASASRRLDTFFHKPDGSWAVTKSGPLHAEMDNEPSIASPWLYLFTGEPWKTQETVRQAMRRIWTNTPTAFRAMTIWERCPPGMSGPRSASTRSIPGEPIWWWSARCFPQRRSAARVPALSFVQRVLRRPFLMCHRWQSTSGKANSHGCRRTLLSMAERWTLPWRPRRKGHGERRHRLPSLLIDPAARLYGASDL